MKKPDIKLDSSKSKGLVILEYILLALCLCVIAFRTTFIEAPHARMMGSVNLGTPVYSLLVSTLLIIAFAVWLIYGLCSGKFFYRRAGIEFGLCLFAVAALISGLAASNKRAAVTDFVVIAAALLMMLVLVQILDSSGKIKLALMVIVALGVVSAWQCVDQLITSNQVMIEQYEQDPESVLGPFGIEPGSLQHMLFEHRLYSKDIRGFFTTGNSAGSFALVASFAAVALFLEKIRNFKAKKIKLTALLACGAVTVAVITGFIATHSKGAITAGLIAAVIFVILLRFDNRIRAHRKAILIACLLLAVVVGFLVVSYGLSHGRLPGGNSMLVRWQYWHAAARMYADHLLTGVGPANFTNFYPHYKPAEALETVSDPHNFILALLTQYGPLGLIGFLVIMFVPLWSAISPYSASASPEKQTPKPGFRKLAIPILIIVSLALLFIRPMIMPSVSFDTPDPDVMVYVFFILYLAPVIIFFVSFLLLIQEDKKGKIENSKIFSAALFSAILGVLIHNTIDFAVFEPGIFTVFCAVLSCLIALNLRNKLPSQSCPTPPPFVRIVAITLILAVVWACFYYCLIPVAASTIKIQKSQELAAANRFEQAGRLLTSAAADDSLSPVASWSNGLLHLQWFRLTKTNNLDLLIESERNLIEATNRNPADFKNYERLTEVYTLLAESSAQQAKTGWLDKAFDSIGCAIERYPGCGRLRIELAEIAEQLGKTDIALAQYEKAVEIEDGYRSQFRIMYPGRKDIPSRVGEEKYRFAKQRIEFLRKQTIP